MRKIFSMCVAAQLLFLVGFVFTTLSFFGCSPRSDRYRLLNQAITEGNGAQAEAVLKEMTQTEFKNMPGIALVSYMRSNTKCPSIEDIQIDELLVRKGIDNMNYPYWWPLLRALERGCEDAVARYIQFMNLDQVKNEFSMADLRGFNLDGLSCPSTDLTKRIVAFNRAFTDASKKFGCEECLSTYSRGTKASGAFATESGTKDGLKQAMEIIGACQAGELNKTPHFKNARADGLRQSACFYSGLIATTQGVIDREREVARRSGAINLGKIHGATERLMYAEEKLQETKALYLQELGEPFNPEVCNKGENVTAVN
jgi:hypothetical protein